MIRTIVTLLAGFGLLALGGRALAAPGHAHEHAKKGALACPVMKSAIKDKAKAPHMMVNNAPVYFCCAGCDEKLRKDPAKYLTSLKDPVSGKTFKVTAKTSRVDQGHALFLFSSAHTKATFEKNPARYIKDGHHGEHGDHH